MNRKGKLSFDPKAFLSKVNGGRSVSDYQKDQTVYTQGEPADSVFYIKSGQVKKTVVSEQGKEAVVALLGTGDFFGEGCLTGQRLRLETVSAMAECVIVRIIKEDITRVIHESRHLQSYLSRTSWLATVVSRRTWSINCSIRAGTDPSASGEFWQGRSAGANHSENQSRDTGGNDRHDPRAREPFHEQISEIGPY
jgi:CRP-like cAMP-binding protein